MKKLLCIICLLSLTGCGGLATRKDLRTNYYHKFEFTVEMEYQEVYRNLLKQVRDRYTFAWPGNRGVVENDIYPDDEFATIRGTLFNCLFGEYLSMRIDIKPLSDARTRIVVYPSKEGLIPSPSISKGEFEKWIKEWYAKDLE